MRYDEWVERIAQLKTEAGMTGDVECVELCRKAINRECAQAFADCVDIIEYAEMRAKEEEE